MSYVRTHRRALAGDAPASMAEEYGVEEYGPDWALIEQQVRLYTDVDPLVDFEPQGPTQDMLNQASANQGAVDQIATHCALGAQGWAWARSVFDKVPAKDRIAVGLAAIKKDPRAAACVKGVLEQMAKENHLARRNLMMYAVVGIGLLIVVTR